jgi:hypothetical protein
VIIDDTSVRATFATGGHLNRCDTLSQKEFTRAALKLLMAVASSADLNLGKIVATSHLVDAQMS